MYCKWHVPHLHSLLSRIAGRRIIPCHAVEHICFMSRHHHDGGFDVAGIQVMLPLAHMLQVLHDRPEV